MKILFRTLAFSVLVALTACSSAPAAPEGVNDRKNRAADYLTFGQQYFQQGQYEQALQFFLIALDLNTAVDYDRGIAVTYNSIASTYLAEGKPDDAEAALTEGGKAADRLKDGAVSLQLLNNRVQALASTQKWDQALELLKKAEPFPSTKEGADLYQSLGIVQKGSEKSSDALVSFQKALTLNTNLKLKQAMASNHFMIASLHNQDGDLPSAIKEMSLALDLDRVVENTVGIGQDLRALGSLTAKTGDKEGAYAFYVRSQKVFQAAGMAAQELKTLTFLLPLAQDLGQSADVAVYTNRKALLGGTR